MNKKDYDVKDVPSFKEEVCNKTCVLKGKCVNEGKDNHWFLMCPHYHRWKIGYANFVIEQIEYDRTHPEEAKARHDAEVAKAIAWAKEQKRLKKEAKDKITNE